MVENVSKSYSINDAINKGYTSCDICRPPASANKISSGNNNPRGENSNTVQCRGTTKNGTRCRHMTSMGNGFCFQHNPDK